MIKKHLIPKMSVIKIALILPLIFFCFYLPKNAYAAGSCAWYYYSPDPQIPPIRLTYCAICSYNKGSYLPAEVGTLTTTWQPDPTDSSLSNGPNETYSDSVEITAASTPGTYNHTYTAPNGLTATCSYRVVAPSSSCSLPKVVLPISVKVGDPIQSQGFISVHSAVQTLYNQAIGLLDYNVLAARAPAIASGSESPTQGLNIRAGHFLVIRRAIDDIYTACNLPLYSWTPNLATGNPILAQDFNDFITAIGLLPGQ